ncbi:MCE family protein [Mycobacterium sp. CBMA293]|uniref:MlaD family protein n=1 Tax=unclassified Mycolicibacterium TaxID=2636767 RepID=UPI0012DD000D|nr:MULTISPECIES: MCE family protein [unclassified Mycolicibacterium]MUL46391.1 MCE family protein [Mycolicibacterium sp. CBMA 360]MUL57096.1 MCE family protein [Mycolicibacterium sp. CBMA 335]MUL70136.1 MCE family protein [Mycolicibacterium sp. CBMA 311]MUL92184.1 MCE family protein [Mycolicibacterium sp. CBMA 230]MUM05924.1 mammalian cell entry protein [Mycolicibacterium sp. CBMA 213]
MGNSFDHDPRGSSDRKLGVIGLCFAVVASIAAVLMVVKSQGKLDDFIRVDLKLINIGDGLPERSDVKFRGVIVGMVSSVTPSQHGQPNVVHVDIQPQFAPQIPDNVTARVVPANLFAVSAVQLVQNGNGARPIRTGDVVMEDQTLPTVLFQNVLAKLRQLLKAVGQSPDANNVGVFAAISEATHGRGQKLTDAGHDLNAVMQQLNSVVKSDDSGPTTLSALKNAADSLRAVSPDLFAALDSSVKPMRTFAEKRSQLTNFLTGGLKTTGTLGDAFEQQIDRMIQVSTGLTPGLGVLADHAGEFHGVSTRLQALANKIYDEGLDHDTGMVIWKAVISMNPSRQYTRADCPRYGAMEGPSCQTAPETPTAPDLKPGLASMGVAVPPGVPENYPNGAPPRFSVPIVPDFPGPPDLDAPPVPSGAPAPMPAPAPPAAPPLPAEVGAPAAPGQVQQQSAPVYGGTVGPVGSQAEKDQLSQIVGGPATSATQLLLGPVARGQEVTVTPLPEGQR